MDYAFSQGFNFCKGRFMQSLKKSIALFAEEDDDDGWVVPLKPIDKKATKRKRGNRETILIITALEKELKELLRILSAPFSHKCEKTTQCDRTYYIYDMTDDNQIVFTTLYGMGSVNSALRCVAAIKLWHPRQVYLTGICAGIEGRTAIGDIIISDQIIDYEMAKIEDNNRVIPRSVYQSDFALNNELQAFQSQKWLSYLNERFPNKDITPSVVSGAILSGNKIIACKNEADVLAAFLDRPFAIKMEASEVATAIHQSDYKPAFVTVKCVSNLADNKSNDVWQEYAAMASASYVIDFILSKTQNESKNFCKT